MKTISILLIIVILTGCTSVKPIGVIGPQKLEVYSVKSNDLLSASRMLVILNKNGDVAAYTGGTVPGYGSIGLSTLTGVANAAAIYMGARAIQKGVQNANVGVSGGTSNNVNVTGVPSSASLNIGGIPTPNINLDHSGIVGNVFNGN